MCCVPLFCGHVLLNYCTIPYTFILHWVQTWEKHGQLICNVYYHRKGNSHQNNSVSQTKSSRSIMVFSLPTWLLDTWKKKKKHTPNILESLDKTDLYSITEKAFRPLLTNKLLKSLHLNPWYQNLAIVFIVLFSSNGQGGCMLTCKKSMPQWRSG